MTKFRKLKALLLTLAITVTLVFSGCKAWSESSLTDENVSSTASAEGSAQTSESSSAADESSVADVKPVQGEATPLIWEVKSSDGNNTLYLFGSIHVAEESVFPLNDTVMNAYNSSDCIAVEFDLIKAESDLQLQMQAAQMMLYSDGTTVKDHLTTETYDKTVAYLQEKNKYSPMLDYYHPFIFQQQLSLIAVEESGLSADAGIDTQFLGLAKADEKEIIEVESMISQVEMSMQIPDEYYEISISSAVDLLKTGTDTSTTQLYNAWKTGDIQVIYSLLYSEEEVFSQEEAEIYAEYERLMMTDRNTLMAETADQIIKDGKNCFFIVGLAHMIGDTGIVSQLEAMGYTVTRI